MNLRTIREQRGLRPVELAYEAGVSVSLLNYAEAGRFVLSPRQVRGIARALGIDPQEVEELRASLEWFQKRRPRTGRGSSTRAGSGSFPNTFEGKKNGAKSSMA